MYIETLNRISQREEQWSKSRLKDGRMSLWLIPLLGDLKVKVNSKN
jgi:hypothetical protein